MDGAKTLLSDGRNDKILSERLVSSPGKDVCTTSCDVDMIALTEDLISCNVSSSAEKSDCGMDVLWNFIVKPGSRLTVLALTVGAFIGVLADVLDTLIISLSDVDVSVKRDGVDDIDDCIDSYDFDALIEGNDVLLSRSGVWSALYSWCCPGSATDVSIC